MTRLYDIQQQIYDLLDEIALADGEITPEQEEKLDGLHASRENKLRNYVRYFRNLDSDVDEINYEVKRLQNRKQQLLNGRERLLDHVAKMLGPAGRFVDAAVGQLKWNNPTGKLEIFGDADDIPAEFKEKVEDWWINRAAIKQALQDGKMVNGAKLVFEKKMRFVAPNPKITKPIEED